MRTHVHVVPRCLVPRLYVRSERTELQFLKRTKRHIHFVAVALTPMIATLNRIWVPPKRTLHVLLSNVKWQSSPGKIVAKNLISSDLSVTECFQSSDSEAFPIAAMRLS